MTIYGVLMAISLVVLACLVIYFWMTDENEEWP